MTFNAANRKHVRQAEKDSKQREARRREVVGQLMLSYNGREYVHDELAACHVFSASLDPNPYVMYFREGERARGSALLDDIMQAAPDQYVIMIQEAHARRTAAELRRGEKPGRDLVGSGDAPDEPASADTEYDPADAGYGEAAVEGVS